MMSSKGITSKYLGYEKILAQRRKEVKRKNGT